MSLRSKRYTVHSIGLKSTITKSESSHYKNSHRELLTFI